MGKRKRLEKKQQKIDRQIASSYTPSIEEISASKKQIIIFLVCAPVVFLIAYFTLTFFFKDALPIWYSGLARFFLKMIGFSVAGQGKIMSTPGFAIEVVNHCVGIDLMSFYLAGILSFTVASWREKIRGILFGIPVIVVMSFIRIVILFIVGYYSEEVFNVIHKFGAQTVMVFLVAGLWLYWLSSLEGTTEA